MTHFPLCQVGLTPVLLNSVKFVPDITGIPVLDKFVDKWPKSRIRSDILEAETGQLLHVS